MKIGLALLPEVVARLTLRCETKGDKPVSGVSFAKPVFHDSTEDRDRVGVAFDERQRR